MSADPSRDRPQPTADGLFLRAHDACHSAASRFERFTALLDGIDSVYGLAVKDRRHDAADAAALVDARETILVPRWNVVVQQGARYMQVSAVELARDILFETCRSWTDRKPLYSSERVVRPAPCLLVAVCRLRAADCLSTQIEMLKGALGMGHYEVSPLSPLFACSFCASEVPRRQTHPVPGSAVALRTGLRPRRSISCRAPGRLGGA